MSTELVTLQVPASLYQKLQILAVEKQIDPVEVIERLITDTHERRDWLDNLTTLRQQIQRDGGLQLGHTKEEVIDRLHETRQEIFDIEYAHLYR